MTGPLRNLVIPALLMAAPLLMSAADSPLASIFAKIDQAAAGFKSFSAKVSHVHHMEAIHEDDSETGTMLVRRSKKDLNVRLEFQNPEPKVMVTDGAVAQVYYPNSGLKEDVKLGSKHMLVDMLLALGFGGNSHDLQDHYTVKLGGQELVNGQSATRLELTPKSPDSITQAKHIDIWVSNESGATLQQKAFESGKDYDLVTYSEIKTNPEIPDSAFSLKPPKGTKIETIIKKK